MVGSGAPVQKTAIDTAQGRVESERDCPRVSVIVPHYSDLDGLAANLDALSRQSYPSDRFEIIVADNASPEGIAAVERVIGDRARLVVVNQPGAGAARNGGVAVAHYDVLAFTDSDCRPHANWLAEGVRALANWDFVGGRVAVITDHPQSLTPVEAFESLFAFRNHAYVREQAFTVTANLICPRKVFDRTGPFDVTGLSEDLEWCHRANLSGFRLGFAREAVVDHPARRTWTDLTLKWRRIDREMFNLAVSRPGGRLHWLRRTMLLPVSAVFHIPAALFRGGVRTFGQRLSAIEVLFRIRFWRFEDSLRLLTGDDEQSFETDARPAAPCPRVGRVGDRQGDAGSGMKTVVHLTCDYPDPLAPSKTRSVKNLVENTPTVRHVIYSLNRVSSRSGVVSLDVGEDLIAVAYHAPRYGILHRTYLLRLANWILDDLSRRGITPDLLHAHKFSVEGIVALQMSKRLRRPFISDIWGDTDLRIVGARPDLGSTWKAISREAAAIIPCAPWAEDKFHASLGLDRRKATVLPPIVMHETFRPSAPRESPALVTLFNLNSHRRKNFANLVTAVVAASRRHPGLTMSVFGACGPATLFELRTILRDAGANGTVTLEGPLDNAVFSETLNQFSAFVMPTRRETFGMVFIEALFAGLPLLHSKGWGVDGFFPDETVGYACRPTDPADIGRGLDYLIGNEALLKSRIAAYHAAGGLERFKRSSIIETYSAILERVGA